MCRFVVDWSMYFAKVLLRNSSVKWRMIRSASAADFENFYLLYGMELIIKPPIKPSSSEKKYAYLETVSKLIGHLRQDIKPTNRVFPKTFYSHDQSACNGGNRNRCADWSEACNSRTLRALSAHSFLGTNLLHKLTGKSRNHCTDVRKMLEI